MAYVDLNLASEAHHLRGLHRDSLLDVPEGLLEHAEVRTSFARSNLVRHVAKRLFISILDMLDVKDRRIRSSQQSMLIGLQHLGKVPDYPVRCSSRLFLRNHVQKTDIVILLDLGSQTGTISSKIVRQFAFVDITVIDGSTSIDLVEIKDLQEVDDDSDPSVDPFLGRFYVFEQRARLQGSRREFQKLSLAIRNLSWRKVVQTRAIQPLFARKQELHQVAFRTDRSSWSTAPFRSSQRTPRYSAKKVRLIFRHASAIRDHLILDRLKHRRIY